jgi:hypothetical protein
VYTQKNAADKQASIEVAKQLTTILKGKQQTGNVYSEIRIPSTDISFRCDPDTQYFSFKTTNVNRIEFPNEIIFAPQEMNTNKMIMWTQPFDTGFPIGVFSYVTTPDLIILIVDDDYDPNDATRATISRKVSEGLASTNITHKIIPNADLNKYINNKNKKIVCIEYSGYTCSGSEDILIEPKSTDPFGYGEVTFKKGGSIIKHPYITKAGLYGAIFSDNSEYYECQMKRALKQYDIKRELTVKRLELINRTVVDADCVRILTNTLNTEVRNMGNINFNNNNNDIERLYTNYIKLEIRNTDLTFSSCPKIY